jgi:hypothetical protein
METLGNAQKWRTLTLPRLGSRVRISSPAPEELMKLQTGASSDRAACAT